MCEKFELCKNEGLGDGSWLMVMHTCFKLPTFAVYNVAKDIGVATT